MELKDIVKNIAKKYDMEGIAKVGVDSDKFKSTLSLGSPSLDFCVYNSIPEGVFIEIFGKEASGKTTLAFLIASDYIRKEKEKPIEQRRHILFVDAEGTADPQWAFKSTGYDMNNQEVQTLYITPLGQTAEQIFDIVMDAVKSGQIGLVIFDSLVAVAPQQTANESLEKKDMGIMAKVMADFVRRSTGLFNRFRTTFIGINGIIMNISGYGCLHGNTKITLVDGRKLTIKEIVENKIEGKVWSLNEKTNEFEPKEIVGWNYNGEVETNKDYIKIETLAVDSLNGHSSITVTPIHEVLTKDGWKQAKDITKNDKIATKYKSVVNGTLKDFLWGTLIGDCTISKKINRSSACIKFQDNLNDDYIKWKVDKLNKAFNFKLNCKNHLKRYTSNFSHELSIIKTELGKRDPLVMLNNHYSDLGLALWYMDDGSIDIHRPRVSISMGRFVKDREHKDEIIKAFKDVLNLDCYWGKGKSLCFTPKSSIDFLNRICKYVPEPMQYKLPNEFKGKYEDFDLNFEIKYLTTYVDVTKIDFASDRQMRMKGKYDLTIKDNHNYLAGSTSNGVVVHNSPETTGGGEYWKRACSLRLKVKRGEYFDEEGKTLTGNAESPAGHVIEMAVIKTKFCRWDRKLGRCHLNYTKGIDVLQDTIEVATHFGMIEKTGGWYSFIDLDTGQYLLDENNKQIKLNGIANVKKYFNEHLDFWKKIYNAVYTKLSIKDDPNIVSFEKMLGLDVGKEFGEQMDGE